MNKYRCIIRVEDGLSFETFLTASNEGALRMMAEAMYGAGKLVFYTKVDD